MKYEPVIGLEIHIELATKSKMFCSCSADYFGAKPNTHTCPICLGLPGAMPKANNEAIKFTQKFGSAIGCKLLLSSKFDRKNYFYPDLAKGFQVSQYDLPFSEEGFLQIKAENGDLKKVRISRAHLEEDTGKLTHATINNRRVTLVDFNRSGVPLMEIVSEPDVESAQEAKLYAQKIRQTARYMGISDADMEKGSMRIEPNISLREMGTKTLPSYKVELKNINSFKFAEKAIDYEIKRQTEILNKGEVPAQETRGFNEQKGITVSQRSKEFAHDYRYFPEPDLPPLHFTERQSEKIKNELPELPDEKYQRFIKKFNLGVYDAEILTREQKVAEYFEEAAKAGGKAQISTKVIANFIINQKPNIEKFLPADLVSQIYRKTQKTYIPDDELEEIVKKVLGENKKAVEDYKKGKDAALQVLVGAVMGESKGNIDPQKAKAMLENLLTH
ncbi:hypothetical protein A2W45_04170 [Candidatus Curtissbacteria bacterium RIFCSPHIGHO2_12_41_11]|uniref:Aspartyl/glutamyl-tRNA(Asn/Gln) amidotransferase subunit B n=2 Tax=Candidatus Curtissiibacteriota TaxID=1752717 RepID=A0A1F5H8Q3_9BACT|nr:MAG: hypothetical protein A3D07_04050 [Candidatus Curtissbacteria bacterium RIFCSPHIGHO2_02_FULL_42_15]OGE00468.1 MAG: hypothetical protein A2W45_04170 [Candidatus Curtissbacteria bacterium RIFCSPHIGHO2_12_41_11]